MKERQQAPKTTVRPTSHQEYYGSFLMRQVWDRTFPYQDDLIMRWIMGPISAEVGHVLQPQGATES